MAAMGEFSIGGTVRKTVAILQTNRRAVLISLGAFSAAPSAFFGLLRLASGNNASADWTQTWRSLPGENVVGGLLGLFATGAIIFVGVKGLDGDQASFEDGFQRARERFLPLVVLSILMGLALVLGVVVFVVPAIFLAVVWSAAQAILVMETTKPTDALARSWRLTEGCRWSILAVLAIAFAVVVGLLMLAGVAGAVLRLLGPWVGALIVTPLLNAAVAGLSAAFVAAIYHELLALKEGGGVSAADIFA